MASANKDTALAEAQDLETTTHDVEKKDHIAAHEAEYLEHADKHEPAPAWAEDTPEEKKLLRKIDMWLMPTIWVLYMFSYMDRSNIGNARIAGMEDDLNLTDNEYFLTIISFFVAYVFFEVPSNMILARSRPSLYVSGIVVLWGAVAGLMALVQTPLQLIMVRFVLGIAEAGFSPAVLYIISTWYRKREQSKRYLCYLSAGILSGAFGGIVAGAIASSLDGAHGIAGWRWLFLVEGVTTVGVGLIAPFFLMDYPSNCKKLTPEERKLACDRLAADNISFTDGQNHMSHWQTLLISLRSWRVWLLSIAYLGVLGPFSFSYFYPMLVRGLGYTAVNAQFMTAPIYFVAFLVAMPVCWWVDRHTHWRGLAVCIILSVGALMAALAAGILDYTSRYVFLCFITASVWTAAPVALGFAADTLSNADPNVRAVSMAFLNTIGNSAQLYGAALFPSSDAPRYLTGFVTWTVLIAFAASLYCTAFFLFRRYPVKGRNV